MSRNYTEVLGNPQENIDTAFDDIEEILKEIGGYLETHTGLESGSFWVNLGANALTEIASSAILGAILSPNLWGKLVGKTKGAGIGGLLKPFSGDIEKDLEMYTDYINKSDKHM